MASLAHVTRTDVLTAIETCDRLGVETFLRANGYGPRFGFQIRHHQRSYPAKAILGVAAGLTHREFFGGIAQTAPKLASLGFQVRKGKRVVADAGLVNLTKGVAFTDEVEGVEDLPVTPSAYFLSGSNNPGEIRALAAVGQDIGVAAPQISREAELELASLAGSDVLVFVDSGAFNEVKFNTPCESATKGEHSYKHGRCRFCSGTTKETASGPRVAYPISDAEWEKRLDLYERLAVALGPQLVVVAPDQVGFQTETLERLERYAGRVRRLHDLGAKVLVAVQKGDLAQAEFATEIDRVLGFTDWTPALPCKKAATTAAEVAAFVQARKPKHVHLLGLGIRNAKVSAYLAPFVGTRCSVSLDSNWITANVGRKGKVRRYTRAQDAARTVLGATLVKVSGLVKEVGLLLSFGLRGVLTWATEPRSKANAVAA